MRYNSKQDGAVTTVRMGLLIQSKNLQSRLFEQSNQFNIIQREADHNQQLSAATEEKLRRENVSYLRHSSQPLIDHHKNFILLL